MRTREVILQNIKDNYSNFNLDETTLELLLDIRDLLQKQIDMFTNH